MGDQRPRRNQVKISEGQIEGEARTMGAKGPRIESEARTEGEARDRAGEGSGVGVRWWWSLPQKINLNLMSCYLVHSLNNNPSFLASMFLFNFRVSFQWEGLCSSCQRRRFIDGQSAEEVGYWEWFP